MVIAPSHALAGLGTIVSVHCGMCLQYLCYDIHPRLTLSPVRCQDTVTHVQMIPTAHSDEGKMCKN